MRIKVKAEIVTMGKPDIDPLLAAGTYVEPKDWNALLRREDVTVIDTRNAYEIHIGKFEGAVNPNTETFRDFPAWAEEFVSSSSSSSSAAGAVNTFGISKTTGSASAPAGSGDDAPTATTTAHAPKAVAMYCTGGIRCEKATAYMRQLGVQEVYHLRGGVLRYLEEVPEGESLWRGECFVFDERVALKHGLQPGSYSRCFACKMPLSEADCCATKAIPRIPLPEESTTTNLDATFSTTMSRYEEGVYCPHCVDKQTPAQRQRFRERQLQVVLARQRGEMHVGQDLPSAGLY